MPKRIPGGILDAILGRIMKSVPGGFSEGVTGETPEVLYESPEVVLTDVLKESRNNSWRNLKGVPGRISNEIPEGILVESRK